MSSDERAECVQLVHAFFDGDWKKTHAWFTSPNPLLGGIVPDDMFAMGRGAKLLTFIRHLLSENEL